MWQQRMITLRARARGFHLVSDELVMALPELARCKVGLLHLWLQHTSASLTITRMPMVQCDVTSSASSTV